jgi:acyl-CoA reductase-like NAD-dependent aldehyde dehydrogenase
MTRCYGTRYSAGAIRIANGTAYGLSSVVCMNWLNDITRFVAELDVSTVDVREAAELAFVTVAPLA